MNPAAFAAPVRVVIEARGMTPIHELTDEELDGLRQYHPARARVGVKP
jgi:hypothetical protein